MALRPRSRRYLARLNSPADVAERVRVERVLGAARVFLTATAMVAVYLDPTEPPRFANVIYLLLGCYAAYSIALWIWAVRQTRIAGAVWWIHAVDVAVPAICMMFSQGPNSPLFAFLVFTLTAAAFRWGFPETVATAVALLLVMSLEAALLTYRPFGWIEGTYEVNRLVIRISYLVGFAVLAGYLGEEQKEWRAESDTVTRAMARVQVEIGLRATMQSMLAEFLRLFDGRCALVIVQQTVSDRVFLWRSGTAGGNSNIVSEEVAPQDRARYLVPLPVPALFARRWDNDIWQAWGVNSEGNRTRILPDFNPAVLPEAGSARSVLAVCFRIGEDWAGQCLLFDAHTGPAVHKELRFAQRLLRRVAPSCYTVYLLRRLRLRAGALERARVARELHDGAIQALIAVEMDVDVLRRRVESQGPSPELPSGLQRVQNMLRQQVLDLRTLMQQMKPLEVGPGQLLEHLAEQVERFRRDTGINAQFVSGVEEVTATPRTCREILRIVQEALVNVRKHSGARNVLLRLARGHAEWKLVIEDDGRGFDFVGSLDMNALDAARRGPEVIKERVRILGGSLHISSEPGHGCQLEITLPQKAHAAYV